MIEVKIPGPRGPKEFYNKYTKAPPYNPVAPALAPPTDEKKTIFFEALRRDKLIKEIVSKIDYKEGDIVKVSPNVKENIYKDHKIEVVRITRSYTQFGKNEKWPENDLPFLVHAYDKDGGVSFWCTANYLVKGI